MFIQNIISNKFDLKWSTTFSYNITAHEKHTYSLLFLLKIPLTKAKDKLKRTGLKASNFRHQGLLFNGGEHFCIFLFGQLSFPRNG